MEIVKCFELLAAVAPYKSGIFITFGFLYLKHLYKGQVPSLSESEHILAVDSYLLP